MKKIIVVFITVLTVLGYSFLKEPTKAQAGTACVENCNVYVATIPGWKEILQYMYVLQGTPKKSIRNSQIKWGRNIFLHF